MACDGKLRLDSNRPHDKTGNIPVQEGAPKHQLIGDTIIADCKNCDPNSCLIRSACVPAEWDGKAIVGTDGSRQYDASD
ncbi:hypothetical protein BKA66DRAFT_19029 [Pyrenochaeta sp. MPI-SDFR-AT-0127]|nr:hypothetical protein BKA66DRAFT_19029 [Pyrenochaeta sp. MPI-SDFR-AT-0127]